MLKRMQTRGQRIVLSLTMGATGCTRTYPTESVLTSTRGPYSPVLTRTAVTLSHEGPLARLPRHGMHTSPTTHLTHPTHPTHPRHTQHTHKPNNTPNTPAKPRTATRCAVCFISRLFVCLQLRVGARWSSRPTSSPNSRALRSACKRTIYEWQVKPPGCRLGRTHGGPAWGVRAGSP